MFCSFLPAIGLAFAAVYADLPTDSTLTITIERTPPRVVVLATAADSARERARVANALFLRTQPTRPVPLLPTTPAHRAPLYPTADQLLDATEPESRTQLRREQERQMIEQALPARYRKRATPEARKR